MSLLLQNGALLAIFFGMGAWGCLTANEAAYIITKLKIISKIMVRQPHRAIRGSAFAPAPALRAVAAAHPSYPLRGTYAIL
jgi:hypothetical protein